MLQRHEFEQRLKWLVNLRWIGIFGVLAATHIARNVEILSFPLLPVYSILGIAALYNIFFQWILNTPRENYQPIALSQIILDQCILALAMIFSGGGDSPFIYFFIFHVVISGLMLSFRHVMLIASLAVIFPAVVVGLNHSGILPHYGIFKEEPMIFTNMTMMVSYGIAFVSTLFFTAYFVAYLSKKELESKQDLKISNLKLTTLLEASRATTSTLELQKILSESLKVVLRITRLKVGIVLLIDESVSRKCYEYFNCANLDCPAYKSLMNCWMTTGTGPHQSPALCHKRAGSSSCFYSRDAHQNPDDKIKTCMSCEYFASTVLNARMSDGLDGIGPIQDMKLNNETIKKALLTGYTIIGSNNNTPSILPIQTVTEIAMPLQVNQQLVGVFYLASDEEIEYTDDNKAFFHLLAEVASSGILSGRLYEDMQSSYLQTVTALANAIEAKDPYTRGHTERVARFSALIADELDLSRQEKEHLRFAAILHDVGKIGISKDLLWKKADLMISEIDSIQTHPQKGVQILEPVSFLKPILATILHHHERFDGSGYPLGLKGKEIPYKARILSIADAWDAMLTTRPYREALSQDTAREELLKNAGSQFDPELVAVFLKIVTYTHPDTMPCGK